MGALFSKKEKTVKVVCCGLDNSGKTTIINHLKPKKQQSQEITPTVGFSVEHFSKNNIAFTVFDMSGQSKYRGIWENFFVDVHAVVFVIDSADRMRIAVVKDELENLLKHKGMCGRA